MITQEPILQRDEISIQHIINIISSTLNAKPCFLNHNDKNPQTERQKSCSILTLITNSKASLIDLIWTFVISKQSESYISLECSYSTQKNLGFQLSVLDQKKIPDINNILKDLNNELFQLSAFKFHLNKQKKIILSALLDKWQYISFLVLKKQLKSMIKVIRQSMKSQLYNLIPFMTQNIKLFFPKGIPKILDNKPIIKKDQVDGVQEVFQPFLSKNTQELYYQKNSKQSSLTKNSCIQQIARFRVKQSLKTVNGQSIDQNTTQALSSNCSFIDSLQNKQFQLLNFQLSRSNSIVCLNTDIQNNIISGVLKKISKSLTSLTLKKQNKQQQQKQFNFLKQLSQKVQKIPTQILNGITFLSEKTISQTYKKGSFSTISKKLNTFVFNYSVQNYDESHQNKNTQEQKKKQIMVYLSYLIQKKPNILKQMTEQQKKIQQNAFLNQWNFLHFLKNQKCSQIGKYYSKNVDKKANASQRLYMQMYRQNLFQFLSRQKKGRIILTIQQKLQIFKDIVKGIQFFYQRNLVHRDLKLSNVMISKDFKAKIIDFGSVCFAYQKQQQFLIMNQYFFSTDGYYFPYQLLPFVLKMKYTQKHYESHSKFDIYSLGVILDKLLFNQLKQQNLSIEKQVKYNIKYIINKCCSIQADFRLAPNDILFLIQKIEMFLKHCRYIKSKKKVTQFQIKQNF